MTQSRYSLIVTPPAQRTIQSTFPEAVAHAVIEFITGPLLDNPRRVGTALRFELEGTWSVRRGTYRILYEIDDEAWTVIILRVSERTHAGFKREAIRRGESIDAVASAALRALRQKEMGEQLAGPLDEDESRWLDAPLR